LIRPSIATHFLAAAFSSSDTQNLFKPRHLVFGFFQVIFQGISQVTGRCIFYHFRQGFGQSFFSPIDVLQAIDQQVAQVHSGIWFSGDGALTFLLVVDFMFFIVEDLLIIEVNKGYKDSFFFDTVKPGQGEL
jgi:hypothetical protein